MLAGAALRLQRAMKGAAFAVFVFAAACAAWSVSIAAHELVGHGGVCAVNPGCSWLYADAMYFDGTLQTGAWKVAELAAGSMLNVFIGTLAFIATVRFRNRLGVFFVPIHLLIPVSFIQAGAYIGLGGFIHDGMDWARLAAMSDAPARTGTAFLVTGAVLILFGVCAAKMTAPIGGRQSGSLLSWPRYLVISYLGFSVTALAASAFVPSEDRWFMLAGGLGGGAFFMSFYLLGLSPFPPLRSRAMSAPSLAQLYAAIVLCFVITAFYVIVLGSGVQFGST